MTIKPSEISAKKTALPVKLPDNNQKAIEPQHVRDEIDALWDAIVAIATVEWEAAAFPSGTIAIYNNTRYYSVVPATATDVPSIATSVWKPLGEGGLSEWKASTPFSGLTDIIQAREVSTGRVKLYKNDKTKAGSTSATFDVNEFEELGYAEDLLGTRKIELSATGLNAYTLTENLFTDGELYLFINVDESQAGVDFPTVTGFAGGAMIVDGIPHTDNKLDIRPKQSVLAVRRDKEFRAVRMGQMIGASNSYPGERGNVPIPQIHYQNRILLGDGMWQPRNLIEIHRAYDLVLQTKTVIAGRYYLHTGADGTFKADPTFTVKSNHVYIMDDNLKPVEDITPTAGRFQTIWLQLFGSDDYYKSNGSTWDKFTHGGGDDTKVAIADKATVANVTAGDIDKWLDSATLKAILDARNVSGNYLGTSDDFATLPNTNGVANDWAVLSKDVIGTGTVDNPQYPRGAYIYDGANFGWGFELGFDADITAATQAEALTTTVPAGHTIQVGIGANFEGVYRNISGAATTWQGTDTVFAPLYIKGQLDKYVSGSVRNVMAAGEGLEALDSFELLNGTGANVRNIAAGADKSYRLTNVSDAAFTLDDNTNGLITIEETGANQQFNIKGAAQFIHTKDGNAHKIVAFGTSSGGGDWLNIPDVTMTAAGNYAPDLFVNDEETQHNTLIANGSGAGNLSINLLPPADMGSNAGKEREYTFNFKNSSTTTGAFLIFDDLYKSFSGEKVENLFIPAGSTKQHLIKVIVTDTGELFVTAVAKNLMEAGNLADTQNLFIGSTAAKAWQLTELLLPDREYDAYVRNYSSEKVTVTVENPTSLVAGDRRKLYAVIEGGDKGIKFEFGSSWKGLDGVALTEIDVPANETKTIIFDINSVFQAYVLGSGAVSLDGIYENKTYEHPNPASGGHRTSANYFFIPLEEGALFESLSVKFRDYRTAFDNNARTTAVQIFTAAELATGVKSGWNKSQQSGDWRLVKSFNFSDSSQYNYYILARRVAGGLSLQIQDNHSSTTNTYGGFVDLKVNYKGLTLSAGASGASASTVKPWTQIATPTVFTNVATIYTNGIPRNTRIELNPDAAGKTIVAFTRSDDWEKDEEIEIWNNSAFEIQTDLFGDPRITAADRGKLQPYEIRTLAHTGIKTTNSDQWRWLKSDNV